MKTTPLHAAHRKLDAKMGSFAGYDMPLYYADGVMKEHEWVRSRAGLFDVSHMGQAIFEGAGAAAYFEKLTPSSFAKMPAGRAKYTVMTNEKGGIVDDLIITRMDSERFFVVFNAGCRDKDIAWMKKNLPANVTMSPLHGRALIALQGPAAEKVIQKICGIDASDMPYMWMKEAALPDGTRIFLSRLGYTGEDGFELSLPSEKAEKLWDDLLAHPDVKPIGLAARDSLRLDMGYCLYGHDIDDDTTPVEAGLSWVMGKDNKSYIGAGCVSEVPSRCRVGVKLLDKGVAREGAVLLDMGGNTVGRLTSGGFSPTLKSAIGQGYVPESLSRPGAKLQVDVRGRHIPAEVVAMPFVQARTKSMKRQAA